MDCTDHIPHQDSSVNKQTTETSVFLDDPSPSQGRNTGGNGSKTGRHGIQPASSDTTEYVSSKFLRSSRQHGSSSDDHCSSALDAHSASSSTQRSNTAAAQMTTAPVHWMPTAPAPVPNVAARITAEQHIPRPYGQNSIVPPYMHPMYLAAGMTSSHSGSQQPIYTAIGPHAHH